MNSIDKRLARLREQMERERRIKRRIDRSKWVPEEYRGMYFEISCKVGAEDALEFVRAHMAVRQA